VSRVISAVSRHSLCQFAHPSQFGQQSRQLEQKITGRHNRIVYCFEHRVRRNKQAEYLKRIECVEKDIEETRIMPSDQEEDTMVYTVVINHEESNIQFGLSTRQYRFGQLLAGPLDHLLASGGDARLRVDPITGLNDYGCRASPRDHQTMISESLSKV
jgi:hypothetical protein